MVEIGFLEEYNILTKLEVTLNDKSELFDRQVKSLIEIWQQIPHFRLINYEQHVVRVMDWLRLHTLNIVLSGEWRQFKNTSKKRLYREIKCCETLMVRSKNIFYLRCRKLAEIIKNPWENPIFNRMLSNPDTGPEEIKFFSDETGYVVCTRIKKLCEYHCEDMALNVITSFRGCLKMVEPLGNYLNTTKDQRNFILDVYIVLLHKYKETELIISTLKALTPEEGIELLNRFSNKQVNISKMWKHSTRIAHVAAQVYITRNVVEAPKDIVINNLKALLDAWLTLYETTSNMESLMISIRRIIQVAESSTHIYTFCEAVYKKFGNAMKPFTIELYIQALTTGMNELERKKSEDDTLKVAEITQQLAQRLLHLADVLDENVLVTRECVLTSFSLVPTHETLARIVNLAKRSGYDVLDTEQTWKCKLHPPAHPSDEILWQCDSCGDFISMTDFGEPLRINFALNEALRAEHLGLAPELCDDLSVVLSNYRYRFFNWFLRWRDLYRLCVLYLADPVRTKNFVTDLKFVDIDYSMFMGIKREPVDEWEGIQHGYEYYLENELYADEYYHSTGKETASDDSGCYSR